jgi:lysophospholipid acyltransferase (LPLAT)-like uncharacterized protein
MKLQKRLVRWVLNPAAVATVATAYLRFVWRTNRWIRGAGDPYAGLEESLPAIVAVWHGQHLLVPFARRPGHRSTTLASRSHDGEIAALMIDKLGARAIRGSGGGERKEGDKGSDKGGAAALRAMVRALKAGETVVMTADAGKASRICGRGIVTLARLSGRPIVPMAIVTSGFLAVNSWDHASIPLPFGRKAVLVGTPVYVPSDATAETAEAVRASVEQDLNSLHERAAGRLAA